MISSMPKINENDFAKLLEDTRILAEHFVNEWSTVKSPLKDNDNSDPGVALLKIFTHMQEEIISRLNHVPDKNFGAFLEMMGLRLMPAQPAKVPVTFFPAEGLAENAFIPAGTQVAAAETDEHKALTYETVSNVSAISALIQEIYSVDPHLDRIYRHTDDFKAGRGFILFEGDDLQRHVLYLGHSTLLKIKDSATIKLKIEFSKAFEDINKWKWFFIDSNGEKDLDPQEVQASDENQYLVTLNINGETKEKEIDGKTSLWIGCHPGDFKGPDWPSISDIRIDQTNNVNLIKPDSAFYNFNPLDLTNEFYPFGRQPRPFDTFYISSREAFSKISSDIVISFKRGLSCGPSPEEDLSLSWEYWNGNLWKSLTCIHNTINNFSNTSIISTTSVISIPPKCAIHLAGLYNGQIEFVNPDDFKEIEVNGDRNYWIRVRLVSGGYGKEEFVQNNGSWKIDYSKINAPYLNSIEIAYSNNGASLEHCIAYNNLEYRDFTDRIKDSQGKNNPGFEPFIPVRESAPAVCIGFDKALSKGNISIFFSLDDRSKPSDDKQNQLVLDSLPKVKFAYDIDSVVLKRSYLEAADNTDYLTKSGTLEFLAPAGHQKVSNFGLDCYWITGLFSIPDSLSTTQSSLGDCKLIPIIGIYPNTVWAEQVETVTDEVLGSSDGEKNQVFKLIKVPATSADVWIREGMVISEEDKEKFSQDSIEVQEVKDRTGKVVDTWTKWKEVEELFDSGSRDRNYISDGASGEVIFGDGIHGMIPPIGRDNIKASYNFGGGVNGNVSAGEINTLKTPVAGIDRVSNPLPAEGGSDTETMSSLFERGPHLIRHMDRAVTKEDFERIAKEASSYIARTKCIVCGGIGNESGDCYRNQIKIIVIPKGTGDRPIPSSELLKIVKTHLLERSMNSISPIWIDVVEPSYKEISITVDVFPESIDQAVPLEREVVKVLKEFFHPITGGPDQTGWDFGRYAYESDIYSKLEGIKGVDHIENLWIVPKPGPEIIKETETICSGEHTVVIKMRAKR